MTRHMGSIAPNSTSRFDRGAELCSSLPRHQLQHPGLSSQGLHPRAHHGARPCLAAQSGSANHQLELLASADDVASHRRWAGDIKSAERLSGGQAVLAFDIAAQSLKNPPMLSALLGGLLIGLSASLAWSGARQVAGISGILGSFLRAPLGAAFPGWFLAGLVGSSLLLGRVSGAWTVASVGSRSVGWLLVAGLLVGFGTQLSNGCTSGHGVCGVSRGAARSLVATLTFMTVAAVVVFLTRHAFAGAVP